MPPKKRNKKVRQEYPTLDLSSPVSLGKSEWPKNRRCNTNPVEVKTVPYSEGNKWIKHDFKLDDYVRPHGDRSSRSDISESRVRRKSGRTSITTRNRLSAESAKLAYQPLEVSYKCPKWARTVPQTGETKPENGNGSKCSDPTVEKPVDAAAVNAALVTEQVRQSTYPVPPDILTPSDVLQRRSGNDSSSSNQLDRNIMNSSSFQCDNHRLEVLMGIENEMPKLADTVEKLGTLRLFQYHHEPHNQDLSRTTPDDDLVPDTPEKDQGMTLRMKQLRNIISI